MGYSAGTAPVCSLWQRINVMQSLRALAGDAYILYFLFTTYDLKQAWILSKYALVSVCIHYAVQHGYMRMRPSWAHNMLKVINGPCRRH